MSQYIALISVSILIFRTWKTGPEWWVKIAPKLYYSLLIVVYLILPSLNILVELSAAISPKIKQKNSQYMAWILFYMVVCISRLIEFFVIIRPKYITDAKTFIHMREDLLHLNAEEV